MNTKVKIWVKILIIFLSIFMFDKLQINEVKAEASELTATEVSNETELRAALKNSHIDTIILTQNITINCNTISSGKTTNNISVSECGNGSFTAGIVINRSVTIQGKNGNQYTIKRSASSSQVARALFCIWGNGTKGSIQVNFKNVIIDGGATWTNSNVKTRTINVTDKKSNYNSGVAGKPIIDVARYGTLNLESGCIVQNGNVTTNAISYASSTARVSGSMVMGGAIRVEYDHTSSFQGGTVNMKAGCIIQDCVSASAGGGVSAYNYSYLNIYGGEIKNCGAGSQGGAIYVTTRSGYSSTTAGRINMFGGSIQECYAKGRGSAMYLDECDTENSLLGGEIKNCTSDYDTTDQRAAIYVRCDNGTVNYSTSNLTFSLARGQKDFHWYSCKYKNSIDSKKVTFQNDTHNYDMYVKSGNSFGEAFPGDPLKNGAVFAGWYNSSNQLITATTAISQNMVVTARYHTHSYIYEAHDNTVAFYCNETAYNNKCECNGREHGVGLSIYAVNKNYSPGNVYNGASLDNTQKDAFNILSGKEVSINNFVYYTDSLCQTKTNNSNSGATSVGGAPKNAGTYYIQLTVNGVSAVKEFEINKINPTLNISPSSKTLTYTRVNQELVTPGRVTNGIIKYRFEEQENWEEAIPSAKTPGTYKIYYKIFGNENYNDLDGALLTSTIITPGTIEKKESSESSISISENSDEIYDKIASVEEKGAIDYGTNFLVWIEVQDNNETASLTSKDKMKNAASQSHYKIGNFIDISMYKQLGDEEQQKVEATNGAVTISIELPEELYNKYAEYTVIREHNGNAEILNTVYDYDTNLLTFKTNAFSNYAIASRIIEHNHDLITITIRNISSGKIIRKESCECGYYTIRY